MSDLEVPSWITVLHGEAPILLVAPHAGRRHDARHPGKHKVNDLHTGPITRELATRLGATAIVNERLDRNQLDLNRVSQVRALAPWFPALLAELLRDMMARADRALVLVIHGWNVTQAVCDVGIGMRERDEALVPVRDGTATVAAEFVARRLRPLQDGAAARGVAVTIGERYPAAHPNNLLQLFRSTGGDAECPLATICRRGTVDAVQLELAIPLRWPGPRRDGFLDLLSGTFGPDASRPSKAPRAPIVPVRVGDGRLSERRGLQFMAEDVVVMTSIDASVSGSLGGRLLISRADDRLALFTGELRAESAPWTVPPLAYVEHAEGGLAVRYQGPLLEFPSLVPFLDLERGLASGALIDVEVDVAFRPHRNGAIFGRVEGAIRLGDAVHRVATEGVAIRDAPTLRALPAVRVTLPAGPWGPAVLSEDPERRWSAEATGRLAGGLVGTRDGTRVSASCEVVLAGSVGTVALAITDGPGRGERLTGALERLIPVRRPGRLDSVVETTYAVVRVDGALVGWTEVTIVVKPESDRVTEG